jgi:hypothetical protein
MGIRRADTPPKSTQTASGVRTSRSSTAAQCEQRPGKPSKLGDHQRVTGSAGGRASRRPVVAVSVGSTVIDVDPIITDAQRVQAIALGGETLLLCRLACVCHE